MLGIFQIFTGLISSSKLFMFIRTLLGVSEAPIYPAGAKLQSYGFQQLSVLVAAHL